MIQATSGSVMCPICNLPRFHGPAGYAGPQCTCHFTQYNITREKEIKTVLLDELSKANNVGKLRLLQRILDRLGISE